MNIQEILRADITRYETEQRQFSLEPKEEQPAKTKIDFRRNILIGEIFSEFFPEVKYFRPQLNKAANEAELEPFAIFLKKIAKYKPVQDAWKQTIEVKQSAIKSNTSEEGQRGEM